MGAENTDVRVIAGGHTLGEALFTGRGSSARDDHAVRRRVVAGIDTTKVAVECVDDAAHLNGGDRAWRCGWNVLRFLRGAERILAASRGLRVWRRCPRAVLRTSLVSRHCIRNAVGTGVEG